MKRRKLKNTALAVCCLMLFGPFISALIDRKETLLLVEDSLESKIKEQENVLGITHFGRPKIDFGPSIAGYFMSGAYDPETDTILILPGRSEIPRHEIRNFTKRLLNLGHIRNQDYVLQHELGHFYTNKLCESLGDIDCNSLAAEMKSIQEGVAEYFFRRVNPDKNGNSNYDDEYRFVKPVIDRFGKDGIVYMLRNLPGEDDLEDPVLYRERAFTILSRNM